MNEFPIDVVVDPRRAQRGFRPVERGLNRLNNRADALRRTIARAFIAIGGGAILSTGIRTIAEFEATLANVQAVSGATAEQFERQREVTERLGATTRFSATEAADALLNLSRAGFSVDESLTSVSDVLNLAIAGNLSLNDASSIAASALRGFRLEAAEAGRVSDVLALGANSANTNVQQLGEGLRFVAPIAAGLNVSLETTTAALGVLSDAGLQASTAGTGLRRVLSTLESATGPAAQILADLGVSAEEVRISQVGLVAALERLREAGIDTGTALQLFGDRGGPAFEVLAAGTDRVVELTASLEDADGAAQAVADRLNDTLQGSLLSLNSAFENLLIQIGNLGGNQGIRSIIDGLTQALRFAAENADTLVNVARNLAIILGPRFVLGALRAIQVVLLANPIGLLAAAIATVIALFPGLQEGLNDFLAVLGDISQEIIDGFDFEATALGLAQFVDGAIALFNGLAEGAGAAFDAIGEQPAELGELIVQGIRNGAERGLDIAGAFAQTLGNLFSTLGTNIAAGIEASIAAGSRALVGDLENAQTQADIAVSRFNQSRSAVQNFGRAFEQNLNRLETTNFLPEVELSAGAQELGDRIAGQFRIGLEESGTPAEDALRALLGGNSVEDLSGAAAQAGAAAGAAARAGAAAGGGTPDAPNRVDPPEPPVNETQLELLRQIQGPQQTYNNQVAELQRLFEGGKISAEQAQQAFDDLTAGGVAGATSLGDGFAVAFARIRQEANDLAAVAQGVVDVFANEATNAILEFTRTGEFEFRRFAQSILEQILQIIVRLLVVQALSAVLPGAGVGGATVNLAGQLQAGGTVQPGRQFLVGEREPEIFTPNTTGTITPLSAVGGQMPPIELTIINARDPEAAERELDAPGSRQKVLNIIRDEREEVRAILN